MPIPDLNEHGLLPAGIHDCSLEEMTAKFAWNDHRQQLMCSFTRFLRGEIASVFDHPVYADGSFVTDKERPNDVDVVLEVLDASDAQKWQALDFMRQHQARIRRQHGVDFWVKLPGVNDFVAFFQYAGHKMAKFKGLDHKHPKGILRIG